MYQTNQREPVKITDTYEWWSVAQIFQNSLLFVAVIVMVVDLYVVASVLSPPGVASRVTTRQKWKRKEQHNWSGKLPQSSSEFTSFTVKNLWLLPNTRYQGMESDQVSLGKRYR